MNPQPDLIPRFLARCPEFEPSWGEHAEWWKGEEAGAYNDLGQLAHFVVEAFADGNVNAVRQVFDVAEEILQERVQRTTDLVVVGLLEDVQLIASHRAFGKGAFECFLGPLSAAAWEQLVEGWGGTTSLAEAIRAERRRHDT